MQISLSFDDALWVITRDGDANVKRIFDRHYSRRHYRDGRNPALFVGPGEKLVLLSVDARAIWIWRRFRSADRRFGYGVNAAAFRNERCPGSPLSSTLVRAAEGLAWARWPGERLYTYVNPAAIRSRNPGACFRHAGWVVERHTRKGLVVLAQYPKSDKNSRKSTKSVFHRTRRQQYRAANRRQQYDAQISRQQ